MILNGPFGWGRIVYPFKILTYYPLSAEEITSWQVVSLNEEGSNFTFMDVYTPSKVSDAGTFTVAASSEKSRLESGALAFGSTFTGTFCPTFSTLQV